MKRLGIFFAAVILLFSVQVPEIFGTPLSINLNCNSNSYLDIADSSQIGLDIAGSFTVEAWVKVTYNDQNGGKYIFRKAGGSGNNSYYWFLNPNSSGLRPGVVYYENSSGLYTYAQDGNNIMISTSEIAAEQWVHIAVTADVPGHVVKFYKNGALFSTANVSTANASSIRNSTAPFQVGGNGNNYNTICGNIKDCRVWDTVRTVEEISANYQQELSGSESHLVGYWKFKGNTVDATSNSNDLTTHGDITSSDDAPAVFLTQEALAHNYIHFTQIEGVYSSGLPEIAALKASDSLVPTVIILDASNSQSLDTINFFDSTYTPKKVMAFDVDNNSSMEISVLASKSDTAKIESRSLSDGSLVKTIILP